MNGDRSDRGDALELTPDRDALVLDVMLGKLTVYLRICGYDALYALDEGLEADDAVRSRAVADGRRLLTRDRALAASTPGSVLLTERDVTDQLRELRDTGVGVSPSDRPARCGACNGVLERVDDEDPRPEHAPAEGPLWRCADCGQHFWRGSHWHDVVATLDAL
ncbi:Mut7-C RNAse domain-containing protein [Halobaculum gomorrense]|uniref:Mut7-C RNAse domain-containing protein n=1 Tax=Halobaculum gomorrense TaxID=43928 RepID=A0A1M5UW98_9EURY|nr:Mut7-C RNAse domain-containing protein [Halobaculum gomorrense]SHH67252.1 hypothetical protein SAMN05443636_3145 [Halobaculum gomorrense]